MQQIYLGLGSNKGDSVALLQKALFAIERLPKVLHLKSSSFYLTSPLEIIDGGGFFVNAVCCFQTTLSPKQLLVELQKIEGDLGKGTKPKNASRFIDIDILFYGKEVYQDEKLEIPHPRWKERLFVLVPLAELTPVIHLHNKQWILSDLIHALSQEKEQTVSLLEKNRLVH